MVKYKIWNKEDTLYPPMGEPYTKEKIFAQWPWAQNPNSVAVIQETGGVLESFDNLEILKNNYSITTEDPKATIAELENIMNQPPASEPTAEERIAAAMEFQNLMSL